MSSALLSPSRVSFPSLPTRAAEPAGAKPPAKPPLATRVQQAPTACVIEPCRLCDVAAGRGDLFGELYGGSPLLPIPGVPRSHAVMMDSFPIAHAGGHVLVTPKYHVPSLAMVASQVALREATRAVADVLEAMFPDHWLFAFEHGPGQIDHEPVACGGCHVDHAHGHILVLPRSVEFEEIRELAESALADVGWDVPRQTSESRMPLVGIRRFVGHNPYLHIGMFAGERSAAFTYRQRSAEESIPSQLMRRLVATAAGRPEPPYWNWKIALAAGLEERIERYRADALGFQAAVRRFVGQHR